MTESWVLIDAMALSMDSVVGWMFRNRMISLTVCLMVDGWVRSECLTKRKGVFVFAMNSLSWA